MLEKEGGKLMEIHIWYVIVLCSFCFGLPFVFFKTQDQFDALHASQMQNVGETIKFCIERMQYLEGELIRVYERRLPSPYRKQAGETTPWDVRGGN